MSDRADLFWLNKNMIKVKKSEFPEIPKVKRNIDIQVQLLLFAKTAGRCEICNELLIRDSLTQRNIIWAEKAHIHAFNLGGSRTVLTKVYCNELGNLMLLCPGCHSKVDKKLQEKEYTIKILQKFKLDHEKKVYLATSAPTINKTKVLKMAANINGQLVKVSRDQMARALMSEGLYSGEENSEEIDFTNVSGKDEKIYWSAKKNEIAEICKRFHLDFQKNKFEHVSVFAIGPIPLLMYLGSHLDNTIQTKFFPLHRDGSRMWHKGSARAKYSFRLVRENKIQDGVALLVSLSGFVQTEDIPEEILKNYTIYELFLDPQPNYNFLRTEKDLLNFQQEYTNSLSKIKNLHKNIKEISIFPAIPAPIAVVCGRSLNKNADLKLKIYNRFEKNKFKYILTIN